jgi:hypothetical protein
LQRILAYNKVQMLYLFQSKKVETVREVSSVLGKVKPQFIAGSFNKLFCIKTGIIINQKSQRSQKYASKKSFKFRASQKASTILKTRRKWRN